MRLIDLHKEWCDKGKIKPCEKGDGLCHSVPRGKYRLDLISFQPNNYWELDFPYMYWAHSEKPPRDSRAWEEYTPLRQTIVLLICAMNNEL